MVEGGFSCALDLIKYIRWVGGWLGGWLGAWVGGWLGAWVRGCVGGWVAGWRRVQVYVRTSCAFHERVHTHAQTHTLHMVGARLLAWLPGTLLVAGWLELQAGGASAAKCHPA